jgi:hypothetical protein
MLPAFRTKRSPLYFALLIAALLLLPLITSSIGHSSREQAYATIADEGGPIGMHVREIFDDPGDTDIVVLGSSLIRYGLNAQMVEQALSIHLGRPARVRVLALNWLGVDMNYFLLHDYLQNHHVKLVLWNAPAPGMRAFEPHPEAYRLVQFGKDQFDGLPLRYRVALYGDMVLGAPREMLSYLRPNLMSREELQSDTNLKQATAGRSGYYGAPFVSEPADTLPVPGIESTYRESHDGKVRDAGQPFDAYEAYFARQLFALAQNSQTRVVIIHIPIDSESGLSYMPEMGRFQDLLHYNVPVIGAASADLFLGMSGMRVKHFYADQHFNANGRELFTRAVIPAILKSYDDRCLK